MSTPYAFAGGYPLMVPAPDAVAGAIADVMAAHVDELRAALEPLGVRFEDVAEPTWMVMVRVGDVEASREVEAPPVISASAAQGLADLAAGGVPVPRLPRYVPDAVGCSTRCESGGCVSCPPPLQPVDVHPEPRNDAAVFGAPPLRAGSSSGGGDDE